VPLRCEVAAAPPRLVPHTPVDDAEGVTVSSRGADVRPARAPRGRVAVLEPLPKRAGGERADIGREIRLRADEAAETQELARAELVGVVGRGDDTQILVTWVVDPEIGAPRAPRPRADTVPPVVGIGPRARRPR